MSDTATLPLWAPIRRFVMSTPKRTFVVYPLLVVLFEFIVYGQLSYTWTGLLFLIWGYAQYKMVGVYRHGIAKGGTGMSHGLPERLVKQGPYQYTRNPMYLGHLIFLFGLLITTLSWLALAIFIGNLVWFQQRVLQDEARLTKAFGDDFTDYKARVKRWIPYLF